MKKLLIAILLSLFIAFPAFGQDGDRATSTDRTRDRALDLRDKIQELRQRNQVAREEFRKRVGEERKELRERIQTKRQELKKKLEKIRDERKRKIVERIDKQLDELNERRLNHFSAVLDKLEKVLERIGSRADKASERGDVSAVRKAIEEASLAIATSRSAIVAQSGKTYTLAINSEEGLRVDVGRSRQALYRDLKAVFDVVKAAREAVHKAATTLAKIPRVNEEPTATSTSK